MNEIIIILFFIGILFTLAGIILIYYTIFKYEQEAIERENKIEENIIKYLIDKNRRQKNK